MYTIQHNPARLYNCDETDITIVRHKHTNILGLKGKRQISFVQSADRGSLVTVVTCTRYVNKVMRLIQYNSVLTFKLQIEFVPFKIVPLGGYTPPETLFPLFVATLIVANRNRF